jgi:hypothetical protein
VHARRVAAEPACEGARELERAVFGALVRLLPVVPAAIVEVNLTGMPVVPSRG